MHDARNEGAAALTLSSESVNEEMMVKCNPELVDALVVTAAAPAASAARGGGGAITISISLKKT